MSLGRYAKKRDSNERRPKLPNGQRRPCEAPCCSRAAVARGLCSGHYQQAKRGEKPGAFRIKAAEWKDRLFDKTTPEPNTGCWLWTGALDTDGYARCKWGSIVLGSHAALEATGRHQPAGMFALHACDNPACVNPAHLSWGTHQENMRQASSRGRMGRRSS